MPACIKNHATFSWPISYWFLEIHEIFAILVFQISLHVRACLAWENMTPMPKSYCDHGKIYDYDDAMMTTCMVAKFLNMGMVAMFHSMVMV